MYLAGYQSMIASEIYDSLVMTDVATYINLYSTSGSGKTTIANSVIEQLVENWMVFYIDGIDNNMSPYLTWFAGTKLHSNKKMHLDAKLSFGVSFVPASYSIEFGFPHKESINYILTPSEEAILLDIKKQTGSNENILIIVDNYEQWDVPSKQFLQKLILPQLNLLDEYRTNILLLSNEKVSFDTIKWEYMHIDNIPNEDILFVLHQNGFAREIDINAIKKFAGNDLSLALMVGKYYDEYTKTVNNVDRILDSKIERLQDSEKAACKILEPLSIIDSFFTQDEAAYFMSSSVENDMETICKAEELLTLAEEQNFIVGNETYRFTNDIIKSFFNSKLSRRAKYLHRKFADYLSIRHPDDYYSRAKHLTESIWKNDPNLFCKAWQLYFLAYARIASSFGWENDIYEIIPKIQFLINQMDPIYVNQQTSILESCIEGYTAFSEYKYRKTIELLQGISPMQLCSALRADILRIVTLCHIQLAENMVQIHQSSTELFDLIESPDFDEDEQYCRAALVLLDAYLDKSNDSQKVHVLKRKITHLINKHLNLPTFLEFNACFNRKSALYYSANIALRQTQESVWFYRNNNNQTGLYMALCNQSANAIVCGDYDCAQVALSECKELVQNTSTRYYPSQYKIYNNEILLSYLIEEAKGELPITDAAYKARQNFLSIVDRQEDETSHVILLNLIALSIFCNTHDYKDRLIKANNELVHTDEYYQYFLHDLNFSAAILNDKIIDAKKELEILNCLDVPLLYPYEPIFRTRRQVQNEILKQPGIINKSPQQYDQMIKKSCARIQDSTHTFWGRGFLLSDLQFLSF